MKKFGLVVASLVAVLLAACGGHGAPATVLTADNVIELTTAAHQKAETVRAEMVTEVEGQGTSTTAGVMKFGSELSAIAMDIAMDMSMGSDLEVTVRVILVDGVGYVSFGEHSDGKFGATDTADDDALIVEDLQEMHRGNDVGAQLEQLRDAITSSEKVGDGGVIDGVTTTEFVLVLDPAALNDEAAFGAVPQALEYRLWVGEDHLIRKMTTDVEGITYRILWTQWGEPITITAPDPDEIVDEWIYEEGFGE